MGPRLLVVEDDRDVRETLVRILGDAGYLVRGAADGHEAMTELRRPEQPRPALLLLDLRMPRMDGRQLYEELARDDELSKIPIIVLSADGRPDAQAELRGAVAVIAKPVRLEKLLGLVESVVGTGEGSRPAGAPR
jgi:CheY-like chemotaxis protein